MKPLYSILHASARETKWASAMQTWLARCASPENVEYVLSSDDPWDVPGLAYGWGRFVIAPNRGPRTSVSAWNTAAGVSSGHIILTIADDLVPPEGWDAKLLEAIPPERLNSDFVIEVSHGGNDNILSFAFLSRHYYERFGYVYYPEYRGMRNDDDFSDVARMNGVIINARHLMFQHLHPHYGLSEIDDVYRHQHDPENYRLGDEIYARRKKKEKGGV